jgi:hypothetical protein
MATIMVSVIKISYGSTAMRPFTGQFPDVATFSI